MREKVGKSRNTVFFQWCVAQEGRKVGSLKRRVRNQLARWEMKNCTPFWREAHFQVKMYKTPQLRSTFRSCDVEKVHAAVARSTFPSQNVRNTPFSDHFLEVEMSKKCTPLWREAHFQAKMYKTHHSRTTFGSWDVEKVHAVVARSTFPSQNVKSTRGTTFGGSDLEKKHTVVARSTFWSQNVQNTRGSDHFWRLRCRFAWQAHEIVDLSKVSTTWGFCSISKKMAGVEHFKMICKDAFSVAGAVQKTCSWERLGGQGADFLRGVTFWSIRSVGLLRWLCMIGAAFRMTWQPVFVAGAVL